MVIKINQSIKGRTGWLASLRNFINLNKMFPTHDFLQFNKVFNKRTVQTRTAGKRVPRSTISNVHTETFLTHSDSGYKIFFVSTSNFLKYKNTHSLIRKTVNFYQLATMKCKLKF